jgi:citrate lyase subunit beta/citryl-CoA lyase
MVGPRVSVAEALRRAPPRSWLIVPALRAAEWLPKALASGADAIIIDLEDATAPAEKDRARQIVRGLRFASRGGPLIVVRVNADGSDRRDAELAAATESGAAAIILPKVDGPDAVRAASACGLALVPMIETARGLLRAADIAAAHELVGALAFGGFDYAADIGASLSGEGTELLYARSHVVVAAAAARMGAIDTPWVDLNDPDGAGREAATVGRLGLAGKLAIHPAQVGPINAAFTPSDVEVAEANGIIEAFEAALSAGSGVATFRGRMIDRPLALAAQRVLARSAFAHRGYDSLR